MIGIGPANLNGIEIRLSHPKRLDGEGLSKNPIRETSQAARPPRRPDPLEQKSTSLPSQGPGVSQGLGVCPEWFVSGSSFIKCLAQGNHI